MTHKKLLWSLLAIIVLWSCGKDDDPAPPAAAPTIANFTPESGPVGTEITITGTNFSTTVASNTVKIGTATATVTAATATQLKATVPTGATTAKVSVTVGGNTATSTKDFNVTVPNGDDPNGDNPTNEAPTAEDQSFEVAEDVAEGEVIGTVEANDGEGDELTFALVTDESELFQVAENGEITLAEGKNLDFETATEHTLTLSVSDGSNDPVEFTVIVNVTNVMDTLFEDPASFILKFDVAAGQELEIGLNVQFEYDYTIDWGDGTEENYTTNENPTHTYNNAETYTVAIKGVFPALQMGAADGSSRNALVDVAQWGTNVWQSMAIAFAFCTSLEGFSATDKPDLSEVTNMNGMFEGATSFNQDIGDWNVSNVTSMLGMFGNAFAFNQDLSSWVTSSVTDMSYMFIGATAFDQSLASWDIGSVETMESMLDNCGMSPENYAKTLIGWADDENGTQTIPESITLGAAGLDYCDNAGTAKVTLQSVLNGGYKWTITDGDAVDCPEFNNN